SLQFFNHRIRLAQATVAMDIATRLVASSNACSAISQQLQPSVKRFIMALIFGRQVRLAVRPSGLRPFFRHALSFLGRLVFAPLFSYRFRGDRACGPAILGTKERWNASVTYRQQSRPVCERREKSAWS